VQVIASFLGLLYDYVGISTHKKVVPDEIKGRIIHHSFPMTLFVVLIYSFLFSAFSVRWLEYILRRFTSYI
jgi:hypothetical protein